MGNRSSSSASKESAVAFIDSKINSHQTVIFSKTYCPYCAKTKSLFRGIEEAKDVEIIELDTRGDGDDIQAALAKKSGQRTVPNVYINGKHVGGNDDVQGAHQKGTLLKMLKQ